MGTNIVETEDFTITDMIEDRDEYGVVVTKLKLVNNTNNSLEVRLPYSNKYRTVPIGTIVPVSIDKFGKVNITFDFPEYDGPYIGNMNQCPFCNTVLLNLTEGLSNELYCFNPECEVDFRRQLLFTFKNLNIILTDIQMNEIWNIMSIVCRPAKHLLAIFHYLHQLVITGGVLSEGLHDVYMKIVNFYKNCSPSDFLKVLKIPPVYYDAISIFDAAYDTVEDFYNGMQNYRSLHGSLLGYDSNMMNLIYAILHTNSEYTNEFFTQKNIAISIPQP